MAKNGFRDVWVRVLILAIAGIGALLLDGSSSGPSAADVFPGPRGGPVAVAVGKLSTAALNGDLFLCSVSNVGHAPAHVAIRFFDRLGEERPPNSDFCSPELGPAETCYGTTQRFALDPPQLFIRCQINVFSGNAGDLRGILESRDTLCDGCATEFRHRSSEAR
jgi:hypothetical protein